MPTLPQHKLYVLEAGALTALSNNASFVREFPFLRNLTAVAKPRCGSCGGSNRQKTDAYQGVKMAIIGLSSAKKLQLKQMLNARQVRIVYQSPGKGVVQHTF